MPASHSGRLTSTDASFLYLERPQAPMHIGAVGILEGELPFDAYVESIEAKLRALPRFRERVVATPFFIGHPTWETHADFDIHNHVKLHRLPAPGGEDDLKALADLLIATMMDRELPLWELHVVHGLADGNSAIISKIHHAMVDGVGGNQILTTILDLSPDSLPPTGEDNYEATEPPASGARVVEALWDSARSSLDSLAGYQRSMLEEARSFGPERLRSTFEVMRSTMPGMALPPRRLPFNRPCNGQRHFTWTRFAFAEARAVRGALGGTVNDVVLAVLAGAVDRYSRHHGEDIAERSMRVMVPVNVRPQSESENLGNLVSVLPVDVPLGIDDPKHRIGLIREATRVLKKGRVADGISIMSNLLGVVPAPFQAAFGSLAVSPFPIFNLVCTNVPGPQIPLYGLGCPLLSYYPYVPVGFDMGVGCAIFSYNQMLHIGLNSDLGACPDVELLRQYLDEAIAEIKLVAGVGDIRPVDMFRRVAAAPTSATASSSRKTAAGKPRAAAKKTVKKRTSAKKAVSSKSRPAAR